LLLKHCGVWLFGLGILTEHHTYHMGSHSVTCLLTLQVNAQCLILSQTGRTVDLLTPKLWKVKLTLMLVISCWCSASQFLQDGRL